MSRRNNSLNGLKLPYRTGTFVTQPADIAGDPRSGGVYRIHPRERYCKSVSSVALRISMGKRIMLVVVGAGIGSLAGLLVSFLGVGNWALIVGAVAGAVIPLVFLGPPSHPS